MKKAVPEQKRLSFSNLLVTDNKLIIHLNLIYLLYDYFGLKSSMQ